MTCNDASRSFIIGQDLEKNPENLVRLFQALIQIQMQQFSVISMYIMIL